VRELLNLRKTPIDDDALSLASEARLQLTPYRYRYVRYNLECSRRTLVHTVCVYGVLRIHNSTLSTNE
jgi:hypothetical protein